MSLIIDLEHVEFVELIYNTNLVVVGRNDLVTSKVFTKHVFTRVPSFLIHSIYFRNTHSVITVNERERNKMQLCKHAINRCLTIVINTNTEKSKV